MHRSGTSMVTRALEQMGLFVGVKKEVNHEATFFLNLNEWLMRQAGGAWDHPAPVLDLWADARLRAVVLDYLRGALAAPRAVSFLGLGRYLAHRSPARLTVPWGWKDPRNTFTLPFWLELFPTARVIHVRRHGVDVAQSLLVRREQLLDEGIRNFRRHRHLYLLLGKRVGFTDSPSCATLEAGLALWEEYLDRAALHMAGLGERALEVRYEEILAEPQRYLELLARFAGVTPDAAAIAVATRGLDGSRAYAYRGDGALMELARAAAVRLQAYGYSA